MLNYDEILKEKICSLDQLKRIVMSHRLLSKKDCLYQWLFRHNSYGAFTLSCQSKVIGQHIDSRC